MPAHRDEFRFFHRLRVRWALGRKNRSVGPSHAIDPARARSGTRRPICRTSPGNRTANGLCRGRAA
jgi:hypothetical protein